MGGVDFMTSWWSNGEVELFLLLCCRKQDSRHVLSRFMSRLLEMKDRNVIGRSVLRPHSRLRPQRRRLTLSDDGCRNMALPHAPS